jgi:hypothetical protein
MLSLVADDVIARRSLDPNGLHSIDGTWHPRHRLGFWASDRLASQRFGSRESGRGATSRLDRMLSLSLVVSLPVVML